MELSNPSMVAFTLWMMPFLLSYSGGDRELRRLAIKQMIAYLWPKGDLGTKALLVTSLSALFIGKLINAQVWLQLPSILFRKWVGGCSYIP
jgi:hypothetical protein